MSDSLTLALLKKRGIETKEAADAFLNPSYTDHLHDPLLMKNMREAATRLGEAITSGEHIAVWGDYDCDGIPGGVILHDFLQKVGADFENYIPHRHLEGYGVNESGIEKLAARGTKLMVTVDSGITDVSAIAHAKKLGMDVIVTDHHLPGEVLPDAIVVDPKAHKDETYPFKELCGAGLAWKLVVATLAVSPPLRAKVPLGWEKWLLDMAALATIADRVPLLFENRVIASYGLLVLRKSPRIGLQKLCRVLRLDQSRLTEDDIGFMVGPRINAASRMGDPLDAFRLFTTKDEAETELLAKKLDKANRARKAEAGSVTRAVHEKLRSRETIPPVIACGDPLWRPALLGLVATGIAEEYGRPVFLWGKEGNGALKGSCRSGDGVAVSELMAKTENVFREYGGHAFSGGFALHEEAIFSLEEKLSETHAALCALTPARVPSDAEPDSSVTPAEVTSAFLSKLERLAPFGEQNPKPVFHVADAVVKKVSRFGKASEHVKVSIARDEFETGVLDAVAFFAKGKLARAVETVGALPVGARVGLRVHLERDYFGARGAVRLRLLDIMPQ